MAENWSRPQSREKMPGFVVKSTLSTRRAPCLGSSVEQDHDSVQGYKFYREAKINLIFARSFANRSKPEAQGCLVLNRQWPGKGVHVTVVAAC